MPASAVARPNLDFLTIRLFPEPARGAWPLIVTAGSGGRAEMSTRRIVRQYWYQGNRRRRNAKQNGPRQCRFLQTHPLSSVLLITPKNVCLLLKLFCPFRCVNHICLGDAPS